MQQLFIWYGISLIVWCISPGLQTIPAAKMIDLVFWPWLTFVGSEKTISWGDNRGPKWSEPPKKANRLFLQPGSPGPIWLQDAGCNRLKSHSEYGHKHNHAHQQTNNRLFFRARCIQDAQINRLEWLGWFGIIQTLDLDIPIPDLEIQIQDLDVQI